MPIQANDEDDPYLRARTPGLDAPLGSLASAAEGRRPERATLGGRSDPPGGPKYLRLDPYKNFGQWARMGIDYIPSQANEIGQRAYQPDLFSDLD